MKSAIRLSATLLVLLAQAVSAQQNRQSKAAAPPDEGPQTQDRQGVERVFIRRVQLPVTVLDKKGQPVSGLKQSDFLVLEDKQPQQIESFTESSESLPLYIAVLLDTSASTAGKLKFEQEAALNFIYTIARPRRDKVALGTFDDEVRLLQDFTDRYDLVDKAIRSIKKPGTQTSLYDAVWQFCNEKMRSAPGRRVIVIITDGDDTYSRATLRDAIDIAQRTETLVFAISTKAGFSGVVPGVEAGTVADKGDRDLERLCEETGGRAFFTGDMLALERSFSRIAHELRSQYIITYRPSNDRYDGSFRRIEVKLVNNRDGWKVRTRRGYTATADSASAQ
jgi:VWFA-related protein